MTRTDWLMMLAYFVAMMVAGVGDVRKDACVRDGCVVAWECSDKLIS